MKDKTEGLTRLGSKETDYFYDNPNYTMLETFPNVYPDTEYIVTLESKEFTSLCPKTGQPDYGEVEISYVPDKKCIETKSFKLYLFAFRNWQSFMETITNKIFDEIWQACEPKWLEVNIKFFARGGVVLTVHRDEKKNY